MKKYIRPEIKVRVLESENLLVESGMQAKGDTWVQEWDDSPTSIDDKNNILSKHSSVWDDEDE